MPAIIKMMGRHKESAHNRGCLLFRCLLLARRLKLLLFGNAKQLHRRAVRCFFSLFLLPNRGCTDVQECGKCSLAGFCLCPDNFDLSQCIFFYFRQAECVEFPHGAGFGISLSPCVRYWVKGLPWLTSEDYPLQASYSLRSTLRGRTPCVTPLRYVPAEV